MLFLTWTFLHTPFNADGFVGDGHDSYGRAGNNADGNTAGVGMYEAPPRQIRLGNDGGTYEAPPLQVVMGRNSDSHGSGGVGAPDTLTKRSVQRQSSFLKPIGHLFALLSNMATRSLSQLD
jgi:hypothetical protein